MNDGPNATWLPNLVGGVSIWKLAVDLNEAKFFDGRLLVPETEGSESLPVTVRWDLSNLLPLNEARAKYPADVDLAIKDFKGALERVAKVFATKDSGFDKYKTAFTVPSVDAEPDAHDTRGNYFYSESTKKLYVINWGASPRSMAGRAEYVFGYEDWGKAFKEKNAAIAAGSVSALAAAPVVAAASDAAAEAAKKKKEQEKKDAEKKKEDDGKKRPWWMWPLFALIAIALVLLALFLLKACEEQKNLAADGGGEASAEAAADGATDGAAADAAAEAGADAAAEAAADAGLDAGAEAAADAGKDAAADGGKDAGKDASASNEEGDEDDDTDSDIEIGPDGKPKPGGKVIITMGGAPGGAAPTAKKAPHRRHYQADAVKWRVVSGNDKVTRTETRGKRFDVWLAKGKTFQGVGVEWQDKTGKWHAH